MKHTWLKLTITLCSLAAMACSTSAPLTGSAPPSSGPREAWQDDWDALVVAAQKEGVLHLMGPQGDENREMLTEPFQRKYGITVEYVGVGGPEATPRVLSERSAGIYHWDIFIVGTTTMVKGLRPIGALDPIEPALFLPEVKDVTKWRGGQLPYFDSDKTGLALLRKAGQYFYANTDQVKPDEIRSWRDLLDPKWKGKILIGRDPRVAGYGRAMFVFFYTHPDLGPDFIRELAQQDLQMMRDDRTSAQWLLQGRYPFCVCSDVEADKLIEAGLPGRVVDPRLIKEGTHATSAYGNVAMANRPPHPNAAKLYANWLLSKEGGDAFAKATHDPSTRVDVSTEGIAMWAIPEPSWPQTNTEKYLALEEPLLELLTQLFGPL